MGLGNNMNLRELELKDAPYMLEWMQDDSVVRDLKTDFSRKTIGDCKSFIQSAKSDSKNIHMAIVDDSDEYMGTVSLKNRKADHAEFAITIRQCAMGKGYSRYAMEACLKLAFEDMGLKKVYWYVSPNNKRAIRFYDKNGYRRDTDASFLSEMVPEKAEEYVWYIACRA
ncbi:MAG: GNAT family N-acetyltransferase [Lachnospiraceae bacterium]